MVRPQQIMESMTTALASSGELPPEVTYATTEIDQTGAQANVRPPILELSVIDSIRVRPHNTDLVGYVTDDDDNRVGRIFDAQFELSLQIDVWTANGDGYDPYEIGQDVRSVLYLYDDHMGGALFPDPDDTTQTLGGIEYFTVGDGSVANDLSMTPALRRWRQTATVWFHERVSTTADTIEDIQFPDADSVA